jgi:hypothetical protein
LLSHGTRRQANKLTENKNEGSTGLSTELEKINGKFVLNGMPFPPMEHRRFDHKVSSWTTQMEQWKLVNVDPYPPQATNDRIEPNFPTQITSLNLRLRRH